MKVVQQLATPIGSPEDGEEGMDGEAALTDGEAADECASEPEPG